MPGTLLTCVALVVVPVGLGASVGVAVRRLYGRRLEGLLTAIVCLAVPAAAVFAAGVRYPIVGPWDSAVEAALVGIGVLWGAHRALADAASLLLLATATTMSLLVLELLARLFLPPPPAFPTRAGIHLLLADALRTDAMHQPWDTLCKDVVCAITYEDEYRTIYDLDSARHDIVTPRTFSPRAGATRRVLHLGDSIAFGFGLPRNQTFTAALERLEPGVQHINAAIPGTAPDAYLAVLPRWLTSTDIDVVVMHVYEGNDLDGLDSRYPCCGWQPLLTYENRAATLRCAHGTDPDFGRAGWAWLRDHNPPPYLLRAAVDTSAAAAHLAAAMAREPYTLADQPLETRLAHLESILRGVADAVAARRIRFVLDVVPARSWLEDGRQWQHYGPQIIDVARRLDIATLDGSEVFRDAAARGQHLFFENGDIHFNAAGHLLWARWLHDQLPTVTPDR
jgi:lysophospholipase L1-like esterase